MKLVSEKPVGLVEVKMEKKHFWPSVVMLAAISGITSICIYMMIATARFIERLK